jgi:hypothetical protein
MEHPRMGVVLAFSGLVGIAIPFMDHKYILLGFLICWGSTLAICFLYFSEWRYALDRLLKKRNSRKGVGKDATVSPIFAIVYFIVPILIYLDPAAPSSEYFVTQWGSVGPETFRIGEVESYQGARASELLVDGALVKKAIGSNYLLVGVSFHHMYSGDVQDEPHLQKWPL